MIEVSRPITLEDLSKYMVETFYPDLGFDEDKIVSFGQWVMGRVLTPDEAHYFLFNFFKGIAVTQGAVKMLPVK